jgi:hypothetical protein
MSIKNLAIALFILVALVIVGRVVTSGRTNVVSSDADVSSPSDQPSMQPPPPVAPAPPRVSKPHDSTLDIAAQSYLGDEFTKGRMKICATAIKFSKRVAYGPKADGIFLLVRIRVRNLDRETRTLDGTGFFVTDPPGDKYMRSQGAEGNIEASLSNKEFQPNIPSFAIIGFEVPQKSDRYVLVLAGEEMYSDSIYLKEPPARVKAARDTLKAWGADTADGL